MPGGIRINPQQAVGGFVKGRWWFLNKDGGNTQKPVNRVDLFTGRTTPTKKENDSRYVIVKFKLFNFAFI